MKRHRFFWAADSDVDHADRRFLSIYGRSGVARDRDGPGCTCATARAACHRLGRFRADGTELIEDLDRGHYFEAQTG